MCIVYCTCVVCVHAVPEWCMWYTCVMCVVYMCNVCDIYIYDVCIGVYVWYSWHVCEACGVCVVHIVYECGICASGCANVLLRAGVLVVLLCYSILSP